MLTPGESGESQDGSPASITKLTGSNNGRHNVLLVNGLHALSCVTCAKRKVKCDRVDPCSNCRKHNIVCEYREPAPKGRKRKAPDSGSAELRARVQKYEELLKQIGVEVPSIDTPPAAVFTPNTSESVRSPKRGSHKPVDSLSDPSTMPGFTGRLVVNRGKSRYVEGNMWSKLGNLERDALLENLSDDDEGDDDETQQIMETQEGGDLVLGQTPWSVSLHNLYPSLTHFNKIWQAFLTNVHPITMICHGPTVHQTLVDAVQSPGHVSKDAEALLFSVMACAVLSMEEDECLKKFGEVRISLLSRARYGGRQALINAKFLLSSNFTVLQALYLYLLAIRGQLDPRALWNLTGILVRNGQRLGLHKDNYTNGLTPFEIEMRRRIWFQIVLSDVMAAQMAGTVTAPHFGENPVAEPLNVNDSDLYPDMKEPPQEREGATEMIFCRLRLKMFSWMRRIHSGCRSVGIADGGIWSAGYEDAASSTKHRFIDEMEKEVELQILRYCDMLDPVHYLTTYVARLILTKMRFTVLHPRQFGQGKAERTKENTDHLFTTALRVIEYDNAAHGERLMNRFLWHSHAHFQWSCLVHVLDELKTRTMGDEVEKAWEQISLAYSYRPEISLGKKLRLPLYMAIHKMSLDAWAARHRAATQAGERVETPEFITLLHERTNSMAKAEVNDSKSAYSGPWHQQLGFLPLQPYSELTPQVGMNMMQNNGTGCAYGHDPLDPGSQFMLSHDTGPVDWSLFDTMINEENLQGFGAFFDDPSVQAGQWQVNGQAY